MTSRDKSEDELLALFARDHGVQCENLSRFDFELLDDSRSYSFKDSIIENTRIKGDALVESTWESCRFLQCEFIGCNLGESRFSGCSFFNSEASAGSSFRFCDLKLALFSECNLSLCKISGSDAHDIKLMNCRLRGLEIEKTKFAREYGRIRRNMATFERCDLMDAMLAKLDLSMCIFRDCSLNNALLSECQLRNAEMTDCDFYGAEIEGADFTGADLRRSSLDGFDLTVIRGYSGMHVSASQQHHLLKGIGIEVWPDE